MVSPILGTAATLGLTVGAGYLFGPVGAVAGALLGSFLFGSGGGPNVEGPRLGDLTVGASTYGNVIPVAFATQKIAGTIIWAPPIEERKDSKKIGGGVFGGGQKVTEYRYFASFAVAFAEGPAAGLVRLWAGEKLLADFRPPNFTEDLSDGASSMRYFGSNGQYKFRFYRGTSDQLPDPLIRRQVEPELGQSHITPGFRDIVYIVFERLALDEFGNRVPPIAAEIAWDNDAQLPERDFSQISAANGGIFPNSLITLGFGAIDWQRGYLYLYRNGNTQMDFVPGLRRYRLLDGQEDLQAHQDDVTVAGGLAVQPECVDADGYLYCRSSVNTIIKVDTETWQRRTRIGGELVDGGGDVPLAEDSEAYEIDILGTVDGPVLRTIEVTERQAVYTAAQQTEDWDAYYPLELGQPGRRDRRHHGLDRGAGACLVADNAHENLTAARTGTYFFRSSNQTSTDRRNTQTVDVTAWANAIDQGSAMARGRAWITETSTGGDDGPGIADLSRCRGYRAWQRGTRLRGAHSPDVGAARSRSADPGGHPQDQDRAR